MSKANRYIVQKTDFPTPKQIFILHLKNISFTNLLQKKYLVIKSQLFKKEIPIKSHFFPIFARLKKEKCH